MRGGMVVSLGPDAARLQAKFIEYLAKAKKAGRTDGIEQIQIDGQTWYRYTPPKPGDKNVVTFGFHGKYFVVGVGSGAVEGILARWNSPTPAWLDQGPGANPGPPPHGRRLSESQGPSRQAAAAGPVAKRRPRDAGTARTEQRRFARLDDRAGGRRHDQSRAPGRGRQAPRPAGHGGRPAAGGQGPGADPQQCHAGPGRAGRSRSHAASVLVTASRRRRPVRGADMQKAVDEFKKNTASTSAASSSAVGDTWCVYNSPAEGEMVFLGWTAVVSVRDRAALVDGWEKLLAAQEKRKAKKDDGEGQGPGRSLCICSSRRSNFASAALPGTRSITWPGS